MNRSNIPWIGVTTYHRGPTGFVKLPGEYADSVRRSGGLPVLLQPGESRLDLLLDGLGGLVITGGGDVDPALYLDEVPELIPDLYGVDEERDAFERDLVTAAFERRMPMLFICRGFQLLNVLRGGTLVVDLPSERPTELEHRAEPPGPTPHEVEIETGCGLARVLGTERVCTASWHHQAVDRLGDGLRVVGSAADGTVEAVEVEGRPEVMAVQWHPELTAAEDPTQQRLFDELVRLAEILRETDPKGEGADGPRSCVPERS